MRYLPEFCIPVIFSASDFLNLSLMSCIPAVEPLLALALAFLLISVFCSISDGTVFSLKLCYYVK